MPAIIATHVPWGQDMTFHHPEEGEFIARVQGRLRVNNGSAMVPPLAGLGLATYPEFFIWDHLQAGRLVEMLTDWIAPPGPICVVTPPGRARPARVRVLLAFLREKFSAQPWAHGIET
jgi:DNA-binding transcriptional LysR family regulator